MCFRKVQDNSDTSNIADEKRFENSLSTYALAAIFYFNNCKIIIKLESNRGRR